MDKFRIDSHKLIYHVGRVNDWLNGEVIYPIYMEVSPIGACNHRCTYCALDFMEYKPRSLDKEVLKNRLGEMGRLGVKSIMYAGEGEPFLHKDIVSIVDYTKKAGIDVAITSNGALFGRAIADKILDKVTWIKISINAGTPKTYSKIHRTRPTDFDIVMKNMAYAAKHRKDKCALGMQLILLPENYKEVQILAKKARDIGMDYLVVKPYSQHPLSKTNKYKDIKYSKYLSLAEKLRKFNTERFNLIFRIHAMQKWDAAQHNYKHCLGLPFWSYIDAGGDIWACSIYLGNSKFRLGNIYKNSFKGIMESDRRRRLLSWAANKLDTACCRINCRMDEVNRYLCELKDPPEHVNFI